MLWMQGWMGGYMICDYLCPNALVLESLVRSPIDHVVVENGVSLIIARHEDRLERVHSLRLIWKENIYA